MSRRTRPSHGGIHTPLAALYHAAHDHVGGLTDIAVQLDKNPDTLRKKLDDKQTSHVLTLDEAMQIMRITKDPRILDAITAELGAVWFMPETVAAEPGDLDLLTSTTSLMSRAVNVLRELEDALQDGDIDADERARLDERFMRLHQASHQVSETARQFDKVEAMA